MILRTGAAGSRALLAALLLGAFSTTRILAQSVGTVGGRVLADRTGEPLHGVTITVKGTDISAVTDLQGRYRLTGVPAGRQTIVADGLGRVAKQTAVSVSAGDTAVQDFALVESAIQLSQVTVTATREAERTSNVAANIGVVGQKDIELARPHHSAEIVNRIPGVLNIDLGGEGSTVAMRLPINYSAVYGYLEDGVPIRSTGFFNHNALYEINVPGADRVEVFKGPASALYGSDAIGGVFNVLTRPPSGSADIELFAEGSEHSYQRTLLSGSNTWGADGVRADVNIMHFGGWRDGAHMNRQTGTLRWDHALSGNARFKTVITATNINSPGDGGSDMGLSDFDNAPHVNYTPIALREVQAVRWSTAYDAQSGPSSWEVIGYARYNRLKLLPFWQLTYDPQVWDNHNKSVGMMAKYRRDFTRGNVIVGADFDYSPGANQEDEILPTMTPGFVFDSFTTGAQQYDYDVTFNGISPYTQLVLNPVPTLHVSAGLRFDHIGYDYKNRLAVVDTGPHRRPASTSVSYSHASPKLGLTWDVTRAVNIFASYRHGFRAPSEDQLFVQGSAENSVGLQPVKANSFESGIRAQAGSRLSLEASAYSMEITDDIVYFYNTTTFTSEVSNAGRTRHRGLEAGVTLALSPAVRLESAFAYVRSQYLHWVTATGTDYSGNQMEAAPRTIANTRLTWAPTGGSAFSAEWARVGWYFTDADNLHRYNGYNVLNLQAATPEIHGFSLIGRLANATDERYAVTVSFNPFVPEDQQDRYTPGLGRTLYLGLQYRAR